MPQPIGYQFAPTFANAELGKQGGSPPTSAQQALQVLSFRLKPRVAGAPQNGLSPLQGQGMSGSGIGQAVLQSVLRTVLGADDVAGLSGAPGQELTPAMLRQLTGSQGPSQLPTIHPGQNLPGDDPLYPTDRTGREPSDVRIFTPTGPDDRTGAPNFGGTPRGTPDPSWVGYQTWMDRERQLSQQRTPWDALRGL